MLGFKQVLVVARSQGGGREGLAVPLQQGSQDVHPGVGEGALGGSLHLVEGGPGTVGGGVAARLLGLVIVGPAEWRVSVIQMYL